METTASAIGFRFLLLTKGSGSVRAKPSHFARQREYSARSAATLRAGAQSKRPKSAKGVWGKTRVFPHKQHIKSSRDYPPKQSGGLFRKHTTQLNYSLSTNKGSSTRCFLYSFYCSTHLSFRYRCSEYHPRSPAAFSAYPSRASEYACAPGSP